MKTRLHFAENKIRKTAIWQAESTTGLLWFLLAFLSAMMVFCVGNGIMYARYLTVSSQEKFNLNVKSAFYLTFDANGGEIATPSQPGGVWIEVSTPSAVKTAEAGKPYGELPVPVRDGYSFAGWSIYPTEMPEGTEQVEYIQNDGEACIDTGIVPDMNYEYEIVVSAADVSSSRCVMGGRNYTYGGLNIGTGTNDFFGPGNGSRRYSYNFEKNVIYRCNIKGGPDGGQYTIWSGEEYLAGNLFKPAPASETTRSVYLFALNSNGTPAFSLSGTRIYSAYIKAGDKMLAEMVPARRKKSNGEYEYGMFDTVSGKFFEKKAGSGNLTGGNVIESEKITEETIINKTCDHRIYALWNKAYCVELDAQGGITDVNKKNVVPGEAYGELPIPERKGYVFTGWSFVPDGFEQQTYIENSGTEFIDIDLVPEIRYKYRIKVSAQNVSQSRCVMGARSTSLGGLNIGTEANDFFGPSGGSERFNWKFSSDVIYSSSIENGLLTVFEGNETKAEHQFTPHQEYATDRSVYIFALNDTSGPAFSLAGTRVYGGYIKDGNTSLCELVPVKKLTSDEEYEYGLYDLARNSFYGNGSGSGVLKGNAETDMTVRSDTIVEKSENHKLFAHWRPLSYTVTYYDKAEPESETIADDGYVAVSYVESDGSRYFDIDFTPDSATVIKAEFELTSTETFGLYGNKNGMTDGGYRCFKHNGLLYGSRGAGVNDQTFPLTTGTRYALTHSASEYTINETDYKGGYSGNKYYPMLVLKDGYTNTDRKPYVFCGKLYSMKIYEGNAVVKDLIPAVRLSDKTIGLYDNFNGDFYVNQGPEEYKADLEQISCTYDKPFYIKQGKIRSWNTKPDLSGEYFNAGEQVINLCTEDNGNINLFALQPYTVVFNLFDGAKTEYLDNRTIVDFRAEIPEYGDAEFLGWKDSTGKICFDKNGKFCTEKLCDMILFPSFSGKEIFMEVEYVESDGNQYFDLDYIPDHDTVITAEFQLTSTETFGLYGNKNAETDGGYRIFRYGDNGLYSARGSTPQNQTPFPLTTGVKYSLVHDHYALKMNGGNYVVGSDGENYYTMVLLKDGYTDGQRKPYTFVGKLYSFRIYEGDTPERDFQPCINLVNGKVGILERSTGIFYDNKGSGELIAGPAKESVKDMLTLNYNDDSKRGKIVEPK